MDRKETIIRTLKPKASAYGFNKSELESVASYIDDNLKVEESATDEEVKAAIGQAVDAVLPVLKLSQTCASRIIDASKRQVNADDADREENRRKEEAHDGTKKGSEWDALVEQVNLLNAKISGLMADKVALDRKSRLEKLLEGTGTFGKSYVKNFAKMQFDDDDQFNEFLSEVKDDLTSYNQERANAGLQALGNHPGDVNRGDESNVKPLEGNEIDEVVGLM